jgi:pyrroloquinoline quinone biosynthesis protein B
VRVRILGSAAGGGLPQWNCRCPTCEAARAGVRARPQTQSSLAIRGADGPWWLVNASPDLRQQLETLDRDRDAVRAAPIAGVLLTDAEIDHTAGLLLLRESGAPLCVYGSPEIQRVLAPTLLRMLERFCGVEWHPLVETCSIDGLVVEPFSDGLVFHDGSSVVTYAPALARLDDAVLARFAASDLVLVDGTFWFDDDLARLGISPRTAADMGHVPLTDSLPALAALKRPRTVLVHINNTNPILLEDSPERAADSAAVLK